ncbi:MAG: competence protein ComEC [Microbacteriaceae bacterium]|nr:competence protein ComEC [Microbacteriaceae bacterium]
MSIRGAAIDLRLAAPAASAWAAAAILVGRPPAGAVVAFALWCVGGALLAGGWLLRRSVRTGRAHATLVTVAVCSVAAALVATAVAVQAPARRPQVLVDAASTGRLVTLEVVTSSTLVFDDSPGSDDGSVADGAPTTAQPSAPSSASSRPRGTGPPRTPPFGATITAASAAGVGSGPAAAVRVGVPALVFAQPPPGRTGIGAHLVVRGTLEEARPGGDVAFLVFASGSARVVADPPWFLDWANGLRAGFATAASRLPGDGGDLLPGLAIGDTAAVSANLDTAMKASSLSHLTAVSGANCAVVVGLIMLLGGAAGLGRRARIAASVVVLAAFVVLVTPQASVVRAAVMATIVLLAMLGGRPVRGVPVLGLAVVVVLTGQPWLARDYGFSLSVLATGGLLVLAGPLTRLLSGLLPRAVAVVVAVPLAAQLACQPLLILLNPTLPLYGVLANVLAEPAAPVATVIGLLSCVLLPVAPPLGQLLAAAAWLPAAWIAAVAALCARLPGAAIPWPGGLGGVVSMAVPTVLLLVAALGPVRRRTRVLAAVVALAVLAGLAGAATGDRLSRRLSMPADWQIAVCEIGQGDAVLVRSAGLVALVDTGPDTALLRSCLETLGIGRIDLLVLSHFDLDHVGGTEAVVGRSDRVLLGPSANATDERLVKRLIDGGAAVERVRRGDSGVLGELRWRVLWPRAGPGGRPWQTGETVGGVEPGNDASVTIAFDPAGTCAGGCLSSLFLGDLGEHGQERVLAAGPVPRVDVVKVSHHGSADQSPRMYESASATVGVISVGADNTYGHPTDRLLDLLAGIGTTAVRTDTDGLVLLSPGGAPGEVAEWRAAATRVGARD